MDVLQALNEVGKSIYRFEQAFLEWVAQRIPQGKTNNVCEPKEEQRGFETGTPVVLPTAYLDFDLDREGTVFLYNYTKSGETHMGNEKDCFYIAGLEICFCTLVEISPYSGKIHMGNERVCFYVTGLEICFYTLGVT